MSDHAIYPKFCLDCGAPVVTRYALRCKSCAAKERLRQRPNTEQFAAIRTLPLDRRALHVVEVDTDRIISLKWRYSHRELDRIAGLPEGSISGIMQRRRATDEKVAKIAKALGVEPIEIMAAIA